LAIRGGYLVVTGVRLGTIPTMKRVVLVLARS
jgi:hypothetical protein